LCFAPPTVFAIVGFIFSARFANVKTENPAERLPLARARAKGQACAERGISGRANPGTKQSDPRNKNIPSEFSWGSTAETQPTNRFQIAVIC
jgi:hypothetical protein